MFIYCRKCLPNIKGEEDIQRIIKEYVDSLSPETKAGERLYQKRLELCADCPDNTNGLCRICGCFVMARAAKKQAYCPAIERRW